MAFKNYGHVNINLKIPVGLRDQDQPIRVNFVPINCGRIINGGHTKLLVLATSIAIYFNHPSPSDKNI